MRRSLAIVSLFLLASVISHADPTGEARKAIQSLYDRQNAGAARKDAAAAYTGVAPKFVGIQKNGSQVTLTEARQSLVRLFANAKTVSGTTIITKFLLKGSEARVTVRQTSRLLLVNPKNAAQTVDMRANTLSDDTWVKTRAGWQETKSVDLEERTTLNGKPVAP